MVSIDITTYDNDDQLVNIWNDNGHFAFVLTDEGTMPVELLRKAAAAAASASTEETMRAAFQAVIEEDGRFNPLISMI